ncbi:MAG: phosphatase PAP2 family protein [Heteroscytonema crispum UTEX LB 1556]
MFKQNFWQFFQSFLSFLKHRLVRHRTSLLLLLLGVFLPLQIFGELAEDIWENEGGFSWDVPILLAIHQIANPKLDILVVFLTKLGVFWGVVPVAVAIALMLLLRRQWYWLTYFLVTLLGSTLINRTAKVLLHRVRPHLWQSPAPEFDYGFPSGHAMASMTLITALTIMTWDTRWRWWVMGFGGLLVLLIGWTRLYLGVHYPSDVLAGWMASIAWGIGVRLLLKPKHSKMPQI